MPVLSRCGVAVQKAVRQTGERRGRGGGALFPPPRLKSPPPARHSAALAGRQIAARACPAPPRGRAVQPRPRTSGSGRPPVFH